MSASHEFALPLRVVSQADLNRLARELEALNDFLTQGAVRQTGKPMSLPKLSALLEDLASTNNVNLLDSKARLGLQGVLQKLKKDAPTIHISFATNPPAAVVQKVLAWFRREVNPWILMQIGLQPGIAAGCVIRTPNRVFDFSLRRRFGSSSAVLVQRIKDTAP